MSRQPGNFTDAERYLFSRWYDPAAANVLHDINNETNITFADAADVTSIPAMTVDADSVVRVNSAGVNGARTPLPFYFNATGGLVTQCFFVASRKMVITGIEELHATAETASGTATLVVTHDLSGSAPGSGTVVMTNTFNLKATANTVQNATLLAVDGFGNPNVGITLNPGDRLSILVGGTATITALAGVSLTVFTRPGFKELTYLYNMQANGSIATQTIAMANRDQVVASVWMTWSAAGTNGSAVTADVTIDTSTGAAGSGTSVLTAAQSVKLTANTPVQVALSGTAANLLMRAGNRLAVKMTGTLTTLAGLVVSVTCGPIGGLVYIGEVQATFALLANGSQGTQGFFIADRDYEVLDASLIWGTAGTDSGTVTADFTIDKGVVAPGGGTSITTGATSVKTTANTTAVIALSTSRRNRLMSKGDLLSIKTAGTLTSLAGVCGAISLAPR